MVTYVTKGGTQKLPQNVKVVESDMTINSKALEEHFLMVPLVYDGTISL
jgi:hypothetical protein